VRSSRHEPRRRRRVCEYLNSLEKGRSTGNRLTTSELMKRPPAGLYQETGRCRQFRISGRSRRVQSLRLSSMVTHTTLSNIRRYSLGLNPRFDLCTPRMQEFHRTITSRASRPIRLLLRLTLQAMPIRNSPHKIRLPPHSLRLHPSLDLLCPTQAIWTHRGGDRTHH